MSTCSCSSEEKILAIDIEIYRMKEPIEDWRRYNTLMRARRKEIRKVEVAARKKIRDEIRERWAEKRRERMREKGRQRRERKSEQVKKLEAEARRKFQLDDDLTEKRKLSENPESTEDIPKPGQ